MVSPVFFFDELAQFVCDGHAVAEKFFAARHVEPTLVYAETLHAVGESSVDFKHLL